VVPQDLRHTREREWARVTTPNTVRTGHARRLGDRVFVPLPVHGARAGRMLGEVESTTRVNRTAERGKRAASDYTEYTEQG
jgi:glycine cleavage system H lipoate-binding protein